MQTITLAEVKQKAREYYEAGKLTAQHPDPEKRMCVNDGGDGYRCAVAAAFNHETLMQAPGGTILSLSLNGIVHIADGDESDAIAHIQSVHDNWAGFSREVGDEHPDTLSYRDKFLKLIEA